jgi:hypothetical protein
MKFNFKALLTAAAGVAAFAFSPANAYEALYPGWDQKPGAFIGSSAGIPPPGIYMVNQVFTYQTNIAGPATTNLGLGNHNAVAAAVDVQIFIFVPGWTFLGANYDFVVAQPFEMVGVGNPLVTINPAVPTTISGVVRTFLDNELSWTKIAGTGFGVKTGLGIWVPTGTIQGPTGLTNVGAPFTSFQPELFLSYLGGGWNLTAAMDLQFNTANSRTNYTTGDIFDVDFTATYTIGKWTFGPVGYYVAQVSNDKCPVGTCTAFYPTGTLGNAQRFQLAAVGGLLEYNFGPASVSVWATQEVYAKASNAAAVALGGATADVSLITRGMTVFGTISYALWNPPAPAAAPMYRK